LSSGNYSDLIKLLGELTKINSVNPAFEPESPGEKEIGEYIINYLDSLGLETNTQEVKPGRNNVFGLLKGSGEGKTLLLQGHMDTVGIDFMDIDPLSPVIKEGKMYGRGTCDMKSGLAAMMSAIKNIVDTGITLKGDLLFNAVCDEEFGQAGCYKAMQVIKADSAIIGEPTELRIQIAHRGLALIQLKTEGVMAHTARHDIGVDAITKMGKVLTRLEERHNQLQKNGHELTGTGSIHAALIEGGSRARISTYPKECMSRILRWMTPSESVEDIKNELSEIIQELSLEDEQFKASYKVLFSRPPSEVSKDEPICNLLGDSIKETLGTSPVYWGAPWYLEQEIISNHGIPTVCFGPTGEGIHTEVEWVDLDSVRLTEKVYESIIKRYCGLYN
jgi:acetylornithine deacetylase